MQRKSLREDLHGYLQDQLLPSLNRRQKSQLRKTKWLKTRKRTKRTRGRPRSLQSQRPTRRTTQKTEKPRATRSRRLQQKIRRRQSLSSTTASHQLSLPVQFPFFLPPFKSALTHAVAPLFKAYC
ncbi:hypothetical protein PHYPO_G00221380 [Pangasianodon hypophthalmus]|uniref:Uncharacterized protein n=1 Tax=Pangasianodon hypophthalmus TaxID=310915 RepID=A0A5N5NV28_PANHP|nr:hypothetical protein PHYPO_G00221380 [Pangasianodon hypophthalmus]